VLQIHSKQVACKLLTIISKKSKDKQITSHPKQILAGETAIVLFKPIKNIWLEPYDTCIDLGRFIIREMDETVAVGKVLETNH
jgi:translation elongation factor EF-1alpha